MSSPTGLLPEDNQQYSFAQIAIPPHCTSTCIYKAPLQLPTCPPGLSILGESLYVQWSIWSWSPLKKANDQQKEAKVVQDLLQRPHATTSCQHTSTFIALFAMNCYDPACTPPAHTLQHYCSIITPHACATVTNGTPQTPPTSTGIQWEDTETDETQQLPPTAPAKQPDSRLYPMTPRWNQRD